MQTKPRLCHVDLLKCLAIYFVLVFHGTLYPNYVAAGMPLSMVARYISRTILSTCVPLFFFVSGYLMLSRPLNLKKHSLRTLKYAFVTCFWILFLLWVLQPYYNEYHNWSELRETIWNARDGWNNHLWYLGSLMGIYLIFPLLKTTFDAKRRSFYWFTAVMVFLVMGNNTFNLGVTLFNLLVKKEFFLYSNNLPVFIQFNPFAWDAALGIAYFCLGGTIHSLEERITAIPIRWRNPVCLAVIPGCCLVFGIMGWRFSLYLKELWDTVWYGYNTVFTLVNVLCLYVLSLSWKRDVPLIRQISSNTLGIYLLHDLVHKSIGPRVAQFAVMRTLPGTMLYAAALLLITLGLCLILRKIPLIKHLIS